MLKIAQVIMAPVIQAQMEKQEKNGTLMLDFSKLQIETLNP